MADKKEKLLVTLSGGGPWGFRLTGGAGTGLPLVVSKVRRKSKSYKKLFENDLILSVNDHSVKNLTYDQVMEIADKSGTDLTLEIQRRESNKENFFPANCAPAESILRTTSPLKTMENETVTKEVISLTETASKKIEEKGGIRIKSATLLPEKTSNSTDYPFENFTSQKLNEDYGNKQQTENKAADPFPSFSELLPAPQGPPKPPRSPVDTSTSSKTEEIRNDDNTVTKITTETMHEIKGNTEIFHKERTRICVQKYHRR
ncbi:synaptopodin-2 [Caerostris darwini]|uniref:Synaptopodin-2 n=1 Tax=Caerostris darwini TaxID=1538125 RepID=A0AAV4UR03_9ARAC|nr:synaptopodin-2 [Caerostris darwini]